MLLFIKKNKTPLVIIGILLLVLLILVINRPQKINPPSQPRPTGSLPPKARFVPKRVLVQFKKTASPVLVNQKLGEYNAKIISTNPAISLTVLEVPEGKENEIIQRLQQDGIVEYAEKNYIREKRFTPNDPNLNQQWHISNVQLPAAWDITKGTGVKIAIVDTGIQLNHPDLTGKIIASKDFSTEGINDTKGHGTSVAGVAAANTNNAVGIAGVCPECQLIIAKDGEDDASIAQAFTWATDQGAKVINYSAGGPASSQTIQNAVAYVWSKGSILVNAVDQTSDPVMPPCDGRPDYPAQYPNVLTVTATGQDDQKVPWACGGSYIKMAAPGIDIYTTTIKSKYENEEGTSFATPIVAGVAALVWSTPYGTSNQAVVDRLCNTADRINGTGTEMTCGRVNAARAVGSAVTPPVDGTVPSPACIGSCPTATPPMDQPTNVPVDQPTDAPIDQPSGEPTGAPIEQPSDSPIQQPTESPSGSPVEQPSNPPSAQPSDIPAEQPNPEHGEGLLYFIIIFIFILLKILFGGFW